MRYILCVLFLFCTTESYAHPQFFVQFKKRYVYEESTDPGHQEWIRKIKTTRCHVCHEGSNKKHRNIYGQALSTLLNRNDRKNSAKIQRSLIAVEGYSIDPNDINNTVTFGDRIAEGLLPGTGE